MKQFVLVFLTIFFLSCSGLYIDDPYMVYYSPHINIGVWIGKNEIDLTALKTAEALVFITFDEMTRQLWAYSYSKDHKHMVFYNITNGIVDIDKSISIERPKKYNFCERIYNNKILYCVDEKNFTIIDLITQNRTDFIIEIDGKPPLRYPSEPLLGFSDDKVIFRNGYYCILEDEFYFFNELKYPRFIASKEKLIGLNYENKIVLYDINSKTTENTNIQRKIFKYSKYSGDDLYFLQDDKLFFSKDLNGFYRIVVMFLPIGYSNREWYVYDLQKRNLSKLTTPHDMIILLGNCDSG